MPFNPDQEPFKQLCETFARKTSPLLIWVGAGLSQPAGLPGWGELRWKLVAFTRSASLQLDSDGRKRLLAYAELAESEPDLWNAFEHLRKALNESSYPAAIRSALKKAETAQVPKAYVELWKLGVGGMITLNIDRLATRGFTSLHAGAAFTEFSGKSIAAHMDSLRSSVPFVANLHGTLDD